jgi:hypothetical protein
MCPHEKRPPVPLDPIDTLDKASLKESIKGLTSIMSSEWVQGELSFEVIQFQTPPLTIPYFIQGIVVSARYNLVVGVNINSTSFALSHLSKNPVLPTTRSLRTRPRSIIEGTRIIHDVPVWYEDVEIALDFHVVEVHYFDVLIGHPVKKMFLDVSAQGTFDITLGGRTYALPINRSKNSLAEPISQEEPVEDVLAVFPVDTPESSIDKVAESFIHEEDDLGETLKLPTHEWPTCPPIELKPLPASLRYAFLNGDTETPIIISDKLYEK